MELRGQHNILANLTPRGGGGNWRACGPRAGLEVSEKRKSFAPA